MLVRLLIRSSILLLILSGCAGKLPREELEARGLLDRARSEGGDRILPEEYASVQVALESGERFWKEGDSEEAEGYFRLARLKGELLTRNLAAEKARKLEETRLRLEAAKKERERQKALEEERRIAEEQQKEREKEAKAAKRPEKLKPERPLPTYHMVRRGETLPRIAARQDVYGDSSLWPLLYRANRDQIKDPRTIWAGQVLRIPRNLGRDEIAEARRYAHERPLQ